MLSVLRGEASTFVDSILAHWTHLAESSASVLAAFLGQASWGFPAALSIGGVVGDIPASLFPEEMTVEENLVADSWGWGQHPGFLSHCKSLLEAGRTEGMNDLKATLIGKI